MCEYSWRNAGVLFFPFFGAPAIRIFCVLCLCFDPQFSIVRALDSDLPSNPTACHFVGQKGKISKNCPFDYREKIVSITVLINGGIS